MSYEAYFTPFFFGVTVIGSTGGIFSSSESDSSWAFLLATKDKTPKCYSEYKQRTVFDFDMSILSAV